ncbi:MarR family winged helix-turn-helix transcriptional regulator [uncultured Nevskia sp.]|uniref:MarR family winged helix-turn-helix transcriptional regulator n=1 Tax=uncultured Nevskia sp. TaxID=228950 RepID=UPI0025ED3D2C|nr:MarR family transcriptional regulator [uncultured Nevskia sp.]
MTAPIKPPMAGRSLDGFLRTGYLIHDVSRLRRALYDQRSRHLGITRSQWWVLFNLSRDEGRPRNQNELAQLLEIGNAAIGELLMRLEKAGFVRRQRVPGDRRSKHVQIAERGREVLEHMRLVAHASNDGIMEGISSEEQRLLDDLLSRMKHNLMTQIQQDDAITGEATGQESPAQSQWRLG